MPALSMPDMTVDEYLAWAEGRPGRYELFAGRVYQLAPEQVLHARVKFAVQTALLQGIRRARLDCHMLPNGMTVRIDRHTAHEPDALVYCGQPVDGQALEVPEPVIVVEVLSPSIRNVDATAKLAGYFSRSSIHHCLIFDPDRRVLLRHSRGECGMITTWIIREGRVRLDPTGIELAFDDLFEAAASRYP